MIDLLLPHATWEHPPDRAGLGPVSHGRWLATGYDVFRHTLDDISQNPAVVAVSSTFDQLG
jgi:hypothetical protein